MKIDPAVQARSNANHIVIEAAQVATTAAILAHVRANPNQTEPQVCYLAGAAGVLEGALSTLADLPVEQRPGIVLSSEIRHDSVRRLFARAVESGAIVRTGWSGGGSAVYAAKGA